MVLDAEVDAAMILAADGTRLPGLGGADLERVELDEDLGGEVVEFARVLDSNGVRLDSIDEAGPGASKPLLRAAASFLRRYLRRAGGFSRASWPSIPTPRSSTSVRRRGWLSAGRPTLGRTASVGG